MKNYILENKHYIILQLVLLLVRLTIAMNAVPCVDVKDEVAMLLTPAHLAGCDWKACTFSASYYGFGFFFLFWPLFVWNFEITMIYRIILVTVSVLQCAVISIINYLMKKTVVRMKEIYKLLIVFIIGLVTVNPPCNLINEHVINIYFWIVILILYKLVAVPANKRRYSLSLAVCMLYGLTLHERLLIVLLAFIVLYVLYYLVFKEKLVAINFWGVLIGGYCLVRFGVNFVQNQVWGSTELINAGISLNQGNKNFDYEILQGFFGLILGNVGILLIFTFSTGLILWLIVVLNVCYGIKNQQRGTTTKIEFVVFMESFLCIGGIIFAIALQKMTCVSAAMSEGRTIYEFKFLTYLRYYIIFVAPILLLGLIHYVEKKQLVKLCINIAVPITIILLSMWYEKIAPLMVEQYWGVSVSFPFSGIIIKNVNDLLYMKDFSFIICFVLVVLLLFVFCTYFEKYKGLFLGIMAFLFLVRYIYFPFNYSFVVAQKQYGIFNAANEKMKEIDNKDIYVYDEEELYPYLLQLYHYKIKIINGLPKNTEEDSVVFSKKPISDKLGTDYTEIKLDDNEWMYVLNVK